MLTDGDQDRTNALKPPGVLATEIFSFRPTQSGGGEVTYLSDPRPGR